MSECMEPYLIEWCIKLCDKMSADAPREILKSGILTPFVNSFFFFESKDVHSRIISLLNNVSAQCETEQDFKLNIVPVLPVMC